REGGRLTGGGFAIAGLVLSAVSTVLALPMYFFLVVPISDEVRDGRARSDSQINLKQISLALHNYHDANRAFPPSVVTSPDGRPLYSWRVLILPFIEQGHLFQQFKLDEPWASPHNLPLLARMPPQYAPPRPGLTAEPHATFYQGFNGPGAFFEGSRKRRITDITDGTSNTIMLVEAGEAVPWSKPADIPFAPGAPLPRLGFLKRGFNILMADGSVRFPDRPPVHDATPRPAITVND